MTGHNSGAVAVMEQQLQKPLQRGVCMMHHLEKPFEHLFAFHDGKSTGPSSYEGEIGKSIEKDDLHELPISNFQIISNEKLLRQIAMISNEDFAKVRVH